MCVHFSNLREWALAQSRCHFLQSHSRWFFETLRQYNVKCHLDEKKIRLQYVFCMRNVSFCFMLLLTSVCGLWQLGLILRTNFAALRNHHSTLTSREQSTQDEPKLLSHRTDVSSSVKNKKTHYVCNIHVACEIFFVIQMAFHNILP